MSKAVLRLTRRGVLGGLAAGLLASSEYPVQANNHGILVHKDPNCTCCTGWVRHLRDAGFVVTAVEATDLQSVKIRLDVPADLAACHTAEADGYVLEGHVPAVAVRRLLTERPAATGLAVPGMPVGSPGMEGGAPKPYDVVLFGPDGRQTFMRFLGVNPMA
ncbi:DUF411 domain-containing protein [Bradyrhizobium niftali]|uniref:DUF411 domain-containing protein n=1 Tax=Bradyrhizobium niftali TaxID=2560055 RepID=A0A4Y9LMF4_9BRAD|nr:DUF411 domain-containing protein [Bradyrhizobium niftali]TFV44511.1 DUF411 domain-containing protein [Bradyrhizobium niftali]